MKINEILCEGFVNGVWDGDPSSFHAKLIHETTPAAAESIRTRGFKPNPEGIFFNIDDVGYSGGAYGGVKVVCNVSGPKEGLLDLTDENELLDDMDGFELAAYAKKHGYWGWRDDIQLAVLDPRHVQILRIER